MAHFKKMVIVLRQLSLLFCHFKNTVAYHSGPYEPLFSSIAPWFNSYLVCRGLCPYDKLSKWMMRMNNNVVVMHWTCLRLHAIVKCNEIKCYFLLLTLRHWRIHRQENCPQDFVHSFWQIDPQSRVYKPTYFIIWLTCLTGLDTTKQVNLLLIKHKQSSQIQPSQRLD